MLAAAQALLLERGTEGTTLAAIGERAGYSRGLATYRFGSKAGLFKELSSSINRRWVSYLSDAVEGHTAIEALCRAVDAYHRFVSDAPDDIRALHILYYASAEPSSELQDIAQTAFRHQITDAEEWVRDGIDSGIIRADVNPLVEATQFVAHLTGMTYIWLLNPMRLEFDRIRDRFKQTLRERLRPLSDSA